MSILERVQEQKEKTEERMARGGGSFSNVKFWKPQDGQNRIRVMPPWDPESESFGDQFWREVAQHWNVSEDQKGPVLCPKNTPDLDGDCPICEFVEELKQDKSNVEAQKTAKEIKAKTTFFLNVVDLKDPTYTAQDVSEFQKTSPDKDCPFEVGDSKIQVYACPVTIFDQILGLITANKQDITDLQEGRNLTIKKFPNKKDRVKTRYEVYPDLEKTVSDVVEPKLPALDTVGFKMDNDQMLELLQSGVGGDYVGALPAQSSKSESYSEPSSENAESLKDAMKKELQD